MSATAQVFDPFLPRNKHVNDVFAGLLNTICPEPANDYIISVEYQLPCDAMVRQAWAVSPVFPDLNALIPADAELRSAHLIRVAGLLSLKVEQRRTWADHHHAWVQNRHALARGKTLQTLDRYEGDFTREETESWLRPGRYCGD